MKKVTVLGGGMVGLAIARDLQKNVEVVVVDRDEQRLVQIHEHYKLSTKAADLLNLASFDDLLESADLVIGAVPGFMGFETARKVILAGKNLVDISFFPEDAFELEALAKKHQVTVCVDCGVAPGMSNLVAGYHAGRMDVSHFSCYVGGLPVEKRWPYEYKAPFSPIDVIEEYTRPARLVENGKVVVRPALSEPEILEFDQVGTLEAFNSDGLRSLLKTLSIPNMKEKTLRYPGHRQLMEVFKSSGFFSTEPIFIGHHEMRPVDMTAKLLTDQWKLGEDEDEFTVMRMEIIGKESGASIRYEYELFDQNDRVNKVSSMARTTGYTCNAIADLMLRAEFNEKGIFPPELLAKHSDLFNQVMTYLQERGIHLNQVHRTLL